MTAEPTPKQQEEAREIVTECLAPGQPAERSVLVSRIASALSSRDTEIREVLEGLSKVLTFENGPSQRCWCSAWVHTPACLAARDLWEKLQPQTSPSPPKR